MNSEFHWDFAAILLALSVVSGAIWLIDAVFFARARRVQLAEKRKVGDQNEEGESEHEYGYDQPPLLVDYAKSFFPIFFIVLLLRSFLVEPFRIPSGSMNPTLLIGDFILVNKYEYGIRLPVLNKKIVELGQPKRGDVVVFRYPENPALPFIKRLVGMPGDHITYDRKKLYINGEEIGRTRLDTYRGVCSGSSEVGARLNEVFSGHAHQILHKPTMYQPPRREWKVPEGQYFVLGDNRDNSKDSRVWGMVPNENLIGRAFMIWMNWDWECSGWITWGRIGDSIK